jgi:hypothetical protein
MGEFEGFRMFSDEPGEAGVYTRSVRKALETAQLNTTSVQRQETNWFKYIISVSAVPTSVYDMRIKEPLRAHNAVVQYAARPVVRWECNPQHPCGICSRPL